MGEFNSKSDDANPASPAKQSSLFRTQALSLRHSDRMGTVYIASPVSRWALSLGMAAIASCIVVFLFIGTYTRRESVAGNVVATEGTIKTEAPIMGIVLKLLVEEGQRVPEGAPLAVIEASADSGDQGDTHKAIGFQLQKQHEHALHEVETIRERADESSRALAAHGALLARQADEVDRQITLQKQQVANSRELLVRMEPLREKGMISAVQLEQQRSEAITAASRLSELSRQRIDLAAQLSDLQKEQRDLPLETRSKADAALRDVAAISQSIAENNGRSTVTLRAQRAGTVAYVLKHQGDTTSASETVVSIIPDGSPIAVDLLVPTRAAGFVRKGTSVSLRYQAFPYQKFGQHRGRVTGVSLSALSPADVEAISGHRSDETMYRVRVSIENATIQTEFGDQPLKPGMLVDAELMLETRSIAEWMVEPLQSLRHSGIGIARD